MIIYFLTKIILSAFLGIALGILLSTLINWCLRLRLGNHTFSTRQTKGQLRLIIIICVLTSLMLFMKFGFNQFFVFYLLVSSVLIVASYIDVVIMVLPNFLTIWGILVFVPICVFVFEQSLLDMLAGAICGSGIFLAFSLWCAKKERGQIGMGDVKLMFMLGALSGIKALPVMLIFSLLLLLLSLPFLNIEKPGVYLRFNVRRGSLPFGWCLSGGWFLDLILGDYVRICFPFFAS